MRQCHVNQIHCKFMEYAVFWGICQFSRSEVFSEQVLLSAAKMYLKAAAAVVLRSRTSYSQVCVYCNTYHHCTLPITLMQQDFRNIGDKIWHNMAHCGTVGMESFPQWSCISSSESFNNLHLLVQTRCGYSAEISSVLSTLSSIKSSYRRYSIAIKRSVISPFGLLSPATALLKLKCLPQPVSLRRLRCVWWSSIRCQGLSALSLLSMLLLLLRDWMSCHFSFGLLELYLVSSVTHRWKVKGIGSTCPIKSQPLLNYHLIVLKSRQ